MTKDAESPDGKRIHIIILTTINERDEKIKKKMNLKGFYIDFFFFCLLSLLYTRHHA